MNIYGIDFTSRPSRRKPITCLECVLDGTTLRAGDLSEWSRFEHLESALRKPGPWIAGIDFPFGQSRRFIENAGWQADWARYVQYAKSLGRKGFRSALDEYRRPREPGDKEHRRATDVAAGSISPQKLYGTPVGLMFYEGAARLLQSGVTIPGLHEGDPGRVVVEAYPGVLARSLIGRRGYKNDTKRLQTLEKDQARRELLLMITAEEGFGDYGLHVQAPLSLADDPGGDHIDALLCAIQAAWAWAMRKKGFGAPEPVDPLEGWIADPSLKDAR